jgi:hypothetical protein
LKSILLACVVGLAASAAEAGTDEPAAVPTEFRHDRIFVVAHAPDGTPLSFYTDSGGGFNAITPSLMRRLGLVPQGEFEDDAGQKLLLVDYPAFMTRAGIPPPSQERAFKGRLAVLDVSGHEHGVAGFLGSRWFAGRVWEIDYPHASLRVLPPDWKATGLDERRAPLGFREGADGVRDLNFPRITIAVDGESLDMLLDTGATARLTETSSPVYGVPVGSRVGASYITTSIFERWVSRHPDWRVIDRADSVTGRAFPMIRVPAITVGGQTVGPVWFVSRPDANFRDMMSAMMDKPIEGAIGGSALTYFRVVIDYPGAAAYFWPGAATR